VPIIVLSTKEEAAVKAEAFALGANDYIVKLPDRLELIARVRHHSRGYVALLERNEAFAALQASQQVLANDLATAAQYVRSLLPPPQQIDTVAADWRFIPSADLGGDAFGYHKLDDTTVAVYLLDVCGHGVGAALLSVSALNAIRSEALPNTDFHDPGSVLAALNKAFPMERQNDMFFTIWYGVYNTATRRIRWAGGGHPPAVLLAGDETFTSYAVGAGDEMMALGFPRPIVVQAFLACDKNENLAANFLFDQGGDLM
jgi:sigma-B regulation protein RsbU (phosphoserine phosphatase)